MNRKNFTIVPDGEEFILHNNHYYEDLGLYAFEHEKGVLLVLATDYVTDDGHGVLDEPREEDIILRHIISNERYAELGCYHALIEEMGARVY